MNKRDFAIGAIIVTLFGVWGVLATRTPASNEPAPILMKATPQLAIGPNPLFRGDVKSPVTLVEFGDYECPPCARMHSQVQELLSQHQGQVRLVFRQFPLSFHAQAQSAALLAESARNRGKFWPMHDALYGFEGGLTSSHLAQLQREFGLKPSAPTTLLTRVHRDQQDATRLQVQGTPSFFVVTPKGQVWKLNALAQTKQFLSAQ
jgi:NhaA family Na+:H+ antiporter